MKKWISVICTLAALMAAGCSKPPKGKATAPSKINIPEQKLLTLRMKGPYHKMNKAFGQTYAAMGKLALRPGGIAFAIYYNAPAKTKPENYDWEVCVPVNKTAKPDAPIQFRVQKTTEAVSLVYTGPYGTKEHTSCYTKLMAYGSKLTGYKFSGPPREVYHEIKGFRGGKKNITQIYFPIVKK